jgi:glycosyltransferase involved in cell wall biosynthesis
MTSLVLSRFRPDDVRGGAALRNLQNLRALSRLGPVDVASIGVAATVTPIPGVRKWAAFAVTDGTATSGLPGRWLLHRRAFPSPVNCHLPAAVRWLRQQCTESRYDVVLIEGLVLASYIAPLRRLGLPIIFDAHNVETSLCAMDHAASRATDPVLRRVKDVGVRRRIEALERDAVRAADLVWACSDGDVAEIRRRFHPTGLVATVVNAVDVEAYARTTGAATTACDGDWSKLPITLLYPGLFSYGPNADAALRLVDQVLPAIRDRGYQARVVLAGRGPTPAMLERARRDPFVTVTGEVTSMIPFLQQPCVVTLPITVGSGTRLKIVEAFAARSPVVTTARGAEGLDVRDNEHLVIRDNPMSMATAAIDVWHRRDWRDRLCTAAHALVCERYSWSAAAAAIEATLTVLPRRPGDMTSRTPAEVRA